jgi:hypothetical protein
MINPETLSGPKSKELFRTFVEDYNTGAISLYYRLASCLRVS